MFVYGCFKEWRKNPLWSCSYCLAFLLPLNDLRGEIDGLVKTNVLKNLSNTGNVEIPTLFATVKDTGAIDVCFDEDEQYDVNVKDLRADSWCNRRTQTELKSRFSIFKAVEHDAMEERHF